MKKKEFKKTKPSSSHPCTLNVIKALRKTRSLNNETPIPTPTPSCSSPISVKKKPISEKLQKQISKKRKRGKEDTTPNNTQGLKLLKRGCVTMHRILRRKIMGIKLIVNFNEKGESFGDEATEMQSYIGVLGRTKPPIWHDNWKCVPGEIKTKIWDCVLVRRNCKVLFFCTIYSFYYLHLLTFVFLFMYVDGFCFTSDRQEDGYTSSRSQMEGV